MAEMKVEVHVLDMPEVKAILERYKKKINGVTG